MTAENVPAGFFTPLAKKPTSPLGRAGRLFSNIKIVKKRVRVFTRARGSFLYFIFSFDYSIKIRIIKIHQLYLCSNLKGTVMKQYSLISRSYRKKRYVVTVFQKDHYDDRIEYIFTSRFRAQDLYDKYYRFLVTAFADLKDNFSMVTLTEYDF